MLFIFHFIISVVKIVLYFYFLYIKKELKRNMNDGTIIFLTSLLIILTRKILLLSF